MTLERARARLPSLLRAERRTFPCPLQDSRTPRAFPQGRRAARVRCAAGRPPCPRGSCRRGTESKLRADRTAAAPEGTARGGCYAGHAQQRLSLKVVALLMTKSPNLQTPGLFVKRVTFPQ